MQRETISRRRRQVLMMGAGAAAAPVLAMPALEGATMANGATSVVSGRVVSDAGGEPLGGAHIEIWHAAERVAVTADGDGRYFAVISAPDGKLYYRVTHRGHATPITQLRLNGLRQSRVACLQDDTGTLRAAFEMALPSPLRAVHSAHAVVL